MQCRFTATATTQKKHEATEEKETRQWYRAAAHFVENFRVHFICIFAMVKRINCTLLPVATSPSPSHYILFFWNKDEYRCYIVRSRMWTCELNAFPSTFWMRCVFDTFSSLAEYFRRSFLSLSLCCRDSEVAK